MPKRTLSSPPSGKKGGRAKRFKSAGVDLPIDALGIVMQFLAPRELYRIAFVCKDMLKFVTVELVVRSALLHGGSPRKTIEALYPLMQNQSIHPVSALRLLRLVNCRRCEYCKRSSMRTIRPNYGVALCFQACLVGEGFTEKLRPFRLYGLKAYPRIATGEEKRGWVYMWNRDLVQNGETCGPILTLGGIDATGRSANKIQQLLQDAPSAEAYQAFVRTYEEFETAAETAQQERQDRLARKEEAKKQKFLDKVLKMIENIKSMVNDPAWRDVMLSFRFATEEERYRDAMVPILIFHCPAVDVLLRQYVHVPKECRATQAREIADKINGYIDVIERSHILGFSFLSETDPFEKKLKQFFQTKYPDRLSFVFHPNANETFFEVLEENGCFDALFHRLVRGKFWDEFMLDSAGEGIPKNHGILSRQVWRQEREAHKSEMDTRKRLSRVYASFKSAYPKCLETLSDYCAWLHSADNSINVSEAREKVLGDPSCFEYLRKKDFEGLRMYSRNPAPGIGFRLDDLLKAHLE